VKIIGIETRVVKVPQPGDPNAGTAGLHGTASQLSALTEPEYQLVPPFRSAYPKKVHTLLVRMLTDDGIIGLGECQAPVAPEAPAALIDRLLAPMLIGQDPLERELLWERMYASMRERGHTSGFMLDAISALDIALWDLAGKSQQQPVHRLLGEAHRSRVPVYVSGLPGATREARVRAAQVFAAQGFTTIKLFLGHGFAEDVAEVEAVRTATGNDVRLLVDVQWLYDVPTAIALGRALERLGVFWLETPIIPEDTAGHVKICDELVVAVAIGECERTRYQFQPLLAQHAVDIVQPDVGRAGGITETRKIAALAESFGVPCALHLGVGLAAYIAASAHLAICLPNLLYLEYQPAMLRLANTFLVEPLLCERGFLEIPQGAGLGIEWNEMALAPFVTQRTQLGLWE
jgi:galactonate dehydratase